MLDEREFKIHDPEAVARRILCLAALHLRADFEVIARSVRDIDEALNRGGAKEDLLTWIESEGLSGDQSANERRLVAIDIGEWSERDLINASWRKEALGTLGWSLGLNGLMPAYDTEFNPGQAISGIPILQAVSQFVTSASLRPDEEILRERQIAQLWHWRSRTMQLHNQNHQLPDGLTFEKIIEATARAAHKSGEIPDVIEGDFPVLGKGYAALSPKEYSTVTSIAVERHFALNWLCGFSDDWDKTPTDT